MFKYRAFNIPDFDEKIINNQKLETFLNKCGEDGWELMSIITVKPVIPVKHVTYLFVFKKESK